MPSLYACIPACGRVFGGSGPLTTHQRHCRIWHSDQLEVRKKYREAKSHRSKTAREKLFLSKATPVSGNEIPMVVDSNLEPPITSFNMSTEANGSLSTESGRPKRSRRLPARYRDALPVPPIPVITPPSEPEPTGSRIKWLMLIVRDRFVTAINVFGIWRDYPHRPSYDPDTLIDSVDLSNHRSPPTANASSLNSMPPPPWPFANMTIWRLMSWFNSGSNLKTELEVNRLAKEICDAGGFPDSDLDGFDVRRENKRWDLAQKSRLSGDDFQEATLEIPVPSGEPNKDPEIFPIPGFHFQSLISVIKAAFESPLADHFHLSPYRLFRKSPITNEDERIFSELYDSDAFIAAHDEIQRNGPLPPDDLGCTREKIVAALMFWLDSTHLTDFGTAKIWPIYLVFGNLSKYIRAQPTSGAWHHLAYIPSVCSFS